MNGMAAAFDSKNIIKELGELSEKTIKGLQTISTIEKIDVGTAPKELVFEEDKLQLYHYVQEGKITCKVPVLIVYALVNRQYMLDLQPDRSLIRKLLQKGLDIYIIDWGYPTKQDMYVTLDDYIDEYINDCVDFITKTTPAKKVNLMGICQGGTFSTIYAALYPEKVQNLVTLVTPIDFDTHDALLFSWADYMDADKIAEVFRVVPGEFLNAGFLMMAPFTLNIRKYVEMIDIMEDREKLLNFLRMEKWIFDSPGQAGAAYSRFIKEMYQQNKLVKGELQINGKKVDLKNIKMPLLNIYASSDHLVPPSSTKPLNDLVGSVDKSLYEFKGGHIGVFVGSKSQKELAPNISKWLHDRSLCDEPQQKSRGDGGSCGGSCGEKSGDQASGCRELFRAEGERGGRKENRDKAAPGNLFRAKGKSRETHGRGTSAREAREEGGKEKEKIIRPICRRLAAWHLIKRHIACRVATGCHSLPFRDSDYCRGRVYWQT